jgi:hypothetical protein
MKIRKRTQENKMFFSMNEYYSIIVDKSIEPLGTRKMDPKVPQESRKDFCRVKGKQIPSRGKL